MIQTFFQATIRRTFLIILFLLLAAFLTGTNPALADTTEKMPTDFFKLPPADWLSAQNQKNHEPLFNENKISPVPVSSIAGLKTQISTFTVTNLNDSGAGSLRQAIADANAATGADIIHFSVSGTITLLNALPDISDVTISGPGASLLTIRRSDAAGTPDFTIFTIPANSPQTSDRSVLISGVTISNGKGAIRSKGNLTVKDCLITDNQDYSTIYIESGYAIGTMPIRAGSFSISNSTISNNFSIASIINLDSFFNGVLNVAMDNCTISGNTNLSSGVISLRDYNGAPASLVIKNSTITNNNNGIEVIHGESARIEYGNSILTEGVYENNGSNGPMPNPVKTVSRGNNIISFPINNGFQRGETISSDLLNVNPRLLPLADYGGQIPTHALERTSPAIDAGNDAIALATDARRNSRLMDVIPGGARSDIGAFEKQIFTVINTNDTGLGSFRQAVSDNNAIGASLINFNIAGTGVKTITLNSALPQISMPVDIDGYSQTGAAANNLPEGNNAALKIELSGAFAGSGVAGLWLAKSYSLVRGLIINRFNGAGIAVSNGVTNTLIQGNFIGTDSVGVSSAANSSGILLESGTQNIVIGTNGDALADAGERNLISGNQNYGIRAQTLSTNQVIAGNYIGTNAAGNAALPNNVGISLFRGVSNTRIGSNGDNLSDNLERNVIAGNTNSGIILEEGDTQNNIIAGNFVGVKANGNEALGNGGQNIVVRNFAANNTIGGAVGNVIGTTNSIGILLDNNADGNLISRNNIGIGSDGVTPIGIGGGSTSSHGILIRDSKNNAVGGANANAGNVIGFIEGHGVSVTGISSGNRILSNRIFATVLLGINLGTDGVAPNDPAPDSDSGANNLQNYPVINSVSNDAVTTRIEGVLTSAFNTNYTIQIYVNQSCNSSGYGEGNLLLATQTMTTAANGTGTFSLSVPTASAQSGTFITATATNERSGDTSEFSACGAVSVQSIQFSSSEYNATENEGAATITVTRSNPTNQVVSVGYQTVAGGTATGGANCSGGADYINVSGTLVWAAGDALPKTFTVMICQDKIGDPNETVNLALSSPAGGVILGTPGAARLTITSDDDQIQMVTNTRDSGAGSLRQAILNANQSSYESVEINFASPLFDTPRTITLSDQLGSRELLITKSVTINGRGANLLTVRRAANASADFRIFNITSGANVRLNGMTITGGKLSGSGSTNDFFGGAIFYAGSLIIDSCLITNSSTTRFGGAIFGSGTLNLQNSTVSNNAAGAFGGGIFSSGIINISSSTISGNINNGNSGGGIYMDGIALIQNSTITDNRAPNGSGTGIFNGSENPVTIRNSIIAGNNNSGKQADVAYNANSFQDSYISEGFNLIGVVTETTAFNQTGDQTGTPAAPLGARLAPLGNYGGTTPTHALFADSIAVNAASPVNQPATDQRGESRIIDRLADIGAYELNLIISGSPAGANPNTLPNGQTGIFYSVQISAARPADFKEPEKRNLDHGIVGILYTVESGSLPDNLILNSLNGLLSGTPTTGGIFNFVIKAMNSNGMASLQPYTLTIFAPTAANVAVGGRVMVGNRGLMNATVILTGTNGTNRTARTNPFGYYRFREEVEAGQTYIISVQAKRYQFMPQVVNLTEELNEINFYSQ